MTISTQDDDTFNNALESAGKVIFTIFAGHIPFGDLLGDAVKLYSLINTEVETEWTSAGEDVVGSFWSRINPNGSGDKGKTINNPLRENESNWAVNKRQNIDVGQFMSVYIDLSTRFQQQSTGYWDWFDLEEPPDLSAQVNLKPYSDKERFYFRLYRR